MDVKKIKTYIGFAKKSGSIIYGIDALCVKRTDLMYLSNLLSLSSRDKCLNTANKNKTKVFVVEQEIIDEITSSTNIKAFGIKNKQLSNAIQNCQE